MRDTRWNLSDMTGETSFETGLERMTNVKQLELA